jgi:hypothetical protein
MSLLSKHSADSYGKNVCCTTLDGTWPADACAFSLAMKSAECTCQETDPCVWSPWSTFGDCDCDNQQSMSATPIRHPQQHSLSQPHARRYGTAIATSGEFNTYNVAVVAFQLRAPLSGVCEGKDTTYKACSCVADDQQGDCMWQPWSSWSECDCASGQSVSTAKAGATACPAGVRSRVKVCAVKRYFGGW